MGQGLYPSRPTTKRAQMPDHCDFHCTCAGNSPPNHHLDLRDSTKIIQSTPLERRRKALYFRPIAYFNAACFDWRTHYCPTYLDMQPRHACHESLVSVQKLPKIDFNKKQAKAHHKRDVPWNLRSNHRSFTCRKNACQRLVLRRQKHIKEFPLVTAAQIHRSSPIYIRIKLLAALDAALRLRLNRKSFHKLI